MAGSRLTVIGALVLVQSNGRCLAPIMPSMSGCSECVGNEIQLSNACVRDNRWFDCYESVWDCCHNPEVMANLTVKDCIKHSENNSVCDDFVTRDYTYSNDECRADCQTIEDAGEDPMKDTDLMQKCKSAGFDVIDNEVVVNDDCFSNWVYGYSEPAEVSGYKVIENVATPAMCQALCQNDPECVRFVWAYDSVKNSEYDQPQRCSLKNHLQVVVPLGIEYTSAANPPNFDEDYCNTEMAHECFTDHYKCKDCQGTLRCVWWSDKHVAGWKYCPDKDSCSLPDFSSSTPRPTSTTTTEVDTTAEATTTTTTTTTAEEPTTEQETTTEEESTTTTTRRTTTTRPTRRTTTTSKPTKPTRPTRPTSTTTEATEPTTVEPTTEETSTAVPTVPTTVEPTTEETSTAAPTAPTTTAETSTAVPTTTVETSTAVPTTTAETSTAVPTTAETSTAVPTAPTTPEPTHPVSTTATTRECNPTTHECHHHDHHECHHHECDHEHHCDGCEQDHGLKLRIHDQPKMIRIAVDN